VKSLSSVVPTNRVSAGLWEGGECSSQCSWTEMLCDRKNSNRCDSKTQGNTCMSKVGRRKESISLINR
jgi:hypothetical protein